MGHHIITPSRRNSRVADGIPDRAPNLHSKRCQSEAPAISKSWMISLDWPGKGRDSCCKSLESSQANLQTMKSSMLQLSQCCQNFMCRRCHFPQSYWACWTFKVPQDGHVTGIRFKALRCLVAQKMAHRFVRTGCLLTILHSRETSM